MTRQKKQEKTCPVCKRTLPREAFGERVYRKRSVPLSQDGRYMQIKAMCESCRVVGRDSPWSRLRASLLRHYGGRCACCGDDTWAFLTIDHVNGDGAAHRRQYGGGYSHLRAIVVAGYPDHYQVLCANCNFAKGVSGVCPHQTGAL